MNDRRIDAFLALENFSEYMEKYEQFLELPRDSRVFVKNMKLMESDGSLTHKEKDKLIQKTRRELLARYQMELTEIKEAILESGVWEPSDLDGEAEISADSLGSIMVRYKHPNGKPGDVDEFIMTQITIPQEDGHGWKSGEVSLDFKEEIAMIAFPKYRLIQEVDYEAIAGDKAMQFLIRNNRIVQAEIKMNEINRLKPLYRNLRSIPDLELKRLLNGYHEMIRRMRDDIYESLIAEGKVRGKWISEQTAFRIVRAHFPDARYQVNFPWLGWQSLDIYIPSRKTAIEYQGKQHFEAVDFFGGEAALEDNRERDQRKRKFCSKHGVRVIDWNFDEPLTEEFFLEHLVPMIERE